MDIPQGETWGDTFALLEMYASDLGGGMSVFTWSEFLKICPGRETADLFDIFNSEHLLLGRILADASVFMACAMT